MIQTIIIIAATLGLACALPTESTVTVDERIVNREETGDRDRTISGSLVDNVKQINVLLNIPNNCNANTIYDDMIRQISDCKSGEDRGHPDLKSGCLLKIDFTMLRSECQNSKLSFPLILRTSGIRDPLATENIASKSIKGTIICLSLELKTFQGIL